MSGLSRSGSSFRLTGWATAPLLHFYACEMRLSADHLHHRTRCAELSSLSQGYGRRGSAGMSPGKPICEGRARGEGKPRNSPLADWPRPRNAQAQSAASLAVAPPSVVCAPSPVSPFTSHAWALGFSPPSLRARPKSTFYLRHRPVVSAVSFVGRNARGSLTQQRCFRRRISRNVVWAHPPPIIDSVGRID